MSQPEPIPHANAPTQPQEADSYATAIDEFLGVLNGSTSRNAGRELTRADFLKCLANTFGSIDGKIVLAWLHATAGTRKPAFTFGSTGTCTHAAATRDGRRGLVWEIEANLADARRGDTTDKPQATAGPRARRKRA